MHHELFVLQIKGYTLLHVVPVFFFFFATGFLNHHDIIIFYFKFYFLRSQPFMTFPFEFYYLSPITYS